MSTLLGPKTERTRDSSSSVCNSSRDSYFQSAALLARMGIKLFKLTALLDFPYPESETSHFVVVCTLKCSFEELLFLAL